MKAKIVYNSLIIMILLINFKSFGQINPETNEFISKNPIYKSNDKQNNYLNSINNNTISCDSNFFWGVNYSGLLIKFFINGSVITPLSIADSGMPGKSLAICNNLNGGLLSPTFYTIGKYFSSVLYYNGDTSWINVNQTPSQPIYNSGGQGTSVYFQNDGFNSLPSQIIKYDGSSFTTFYSWATFYFGAADIAVDSIGNIWCLTVASPLGSQFIDVISPIGQLIKHYKFNLNTYNAYGCFLLNKTFYLGLGSSNPVYPNTLLPITFLFDSAYIGIPISMPIDEWADLASCKPGSPLFIKEKGIIPISDFKLYPNPTDNKITLELNSHFSCNNDIDFSIYNIQGQLLIQQRIIQRKTDFDICMFKKGVYILKLRNNNKIEVTKIVKN